MQKMVNLITSTISLAQADLQLRSSCMPNWWWTKNVHICRLFWFVAVCLGFFRSSYSVWKDDNECQWVLPRPIFQTAGQRVPSLLHSAGRWQLSLVCHIPSRAGLHRETLFSSGLVSPSVGRPVEYKVNTFQSIYTFIRLYRSTENLVKFK